MTGTHASDSSIRGRRRRLRMGTAALLLALLLGFAAGCSPANGPAATTSIAAGNSAPTPSAPAATTAAPSQPTSAIPVPTTTAGTNATTTAVTATTPAASAGTSVPVPTGSTPAPVTPTPVPSPATVTVSVVCHTAVGKADTAPADGIILAPTAVELRAGDTVLTVLLRAVAAANPSYGADNVLVKGGNYVAGIGNDAMDDLLYEKDKDCGPESGWLYYVDGTYAGIGASTRAAAAGETIEWKYTCASGRDLG